MAIDRALPVQQHANGLGCRIFDAGIKQEPRARLVRLILTLAVEREGKLIVPERLTQQDIAERVGASRDMISRLLKDLVAGGYLTIQDKLITVLKKPPPGW